MHEKLPISGISEKKRVVPQKEIIAERFTLEYYKQKENTIEDHSRAVLHAILACIASLKEGNITEGDIKDFLVSGDIPVVDIFSDAESYAEAIGEAIMKRLDDEPPLKLNKESERLLREKWIKEVESDQQYIEAIENGQVPGLETSIRGGVAAIGTTIAPTSLGYRLNIKVSFPEKCSHVKTDLVRAFVQNPTILNDFFAIKTFGMESVLDGVIIYFQEGNASEIIEAVAKYCETTNLSHYRHVSGITMGQPIEDSTGKNLEAVRLTDEPGKEFHTFNSLQSKIILSALKAFLEKNYDGKKEEFLNHMFEDPTKVEEIWDKEFPYFYKEAAKEIIGENPYFKNVAFILSGNK